MAPSEWPDFNAELHLVCCGLGWKKLFVSACVRAFQSPAYTGIAFQIYVLIQAFNMRRPTFRFCKN